MRSDAFIETKNVTELRRAVSEAREAGIGVPAMVMAYGEAGTGKTKAAKESFTDLGGVFMRAFEGMTLAAFMQDLCFEICGSRPHGTNRCRTEIMKALKDNATPIFVDEIDRSPITFFETLRDIHDVTGSPVIFIGEMGLPTRVSARNRINDRIPESFRIQFRPIERNDIMAFARKAADLSLSPEACAFLSESTRGNFRKEHNAVQTLERAARANSVKEIDADFARHLLGKKAGR